jgi:uncharacterized membrane protein
VAGSTGGSLVYVSVGVTHRAVSMDVRVEVAPMPPQQQSSGQDHDSDPNCRLRCLLEPRRQILAEQYDREAEGHQSDRVPQPPGEAQQTRLARPGAPIAQEERGYRREVIRVRRVSQPEQQRDDQGRKAVTAELDDPVIQSEHESPV